MNNLHNFKELNQEEKKRSLNIKKKTNETDVPKVSAIIKENYFKCL